MKKQEIMSNSSIFACESINFKFKLVGRAVMINR